MPQLPSLLAVFGHPDDESLVAGGVLAQHAESGARTAVVTATWAPDTHRAAELADATRILGAGEPRLLGYADHRDASPVPVAQLRGNCRLPRSGVAPDHDQHRILCTRHPRHPIREPGMDPAYRTGSAPADVRAQTEESVTVLGRADLVFVHNPERSSHDRQQLHLNLRAAFAVLEDLAHAGRAGATASPRGPASARRSSPSPN